MKIAGRTIARLTSTNMHKVVHERPKKVVHVVIDQTSQHVAIVVTSRTPQRPTRP